MCLFELVDVMTPLLARFGLQLVVSAVPLLSLRDIPFCSSSCMPQLTRTSNYVEASSVYGSHGGKVFEGLPPMLVIMRSEAQYINKKRRVVLLGGDVEWGRGGSAVGGRA